MLPAEPTPLLYLCFVSLAVLVAGLFVAAVRRATAGANGTWVKIGSLTFAWLALTGGLALAGVLHEFSIPPRVPLLVVTAGVAITWLSFSSIGDQLIATLPAWAVVGSQAFRLPLELSMHRAYNEGVMPVQMSYSGWNFDIATGITAIAVAVALYRGQCPRWLWMAWNIMGSMLLATVVTIAVLSFPTPFQMIASDPPNVWVTHVPFIWLPTVLVPAALLGHLLTLRQLRKTAAGA
jgi:hypothetical protein